MKLAVFHYHFRPGGVRRVIELALPHLIRAVEPRIDRVVLAGGESPDLHWTHYLTEKLSRMSVELPTDPALGYFADSGLPAAACRKRSRRAVAEILRGDDGSNCVVWAHNLGLARNPFLAEALAEVTARQSIPLLAHYHDWWFDNRWQRWPELSGAGYSTLDHTAALVFPSEANVRHLAINRADAAPLRCHFGERAGWLPNLMDSLPPVSEARAARARAWLEARTEKGAPAWLFPCRLLRRKNVAEALLLTRWLRPGAWLVTTGGPSSQGERAYAQALRDAAARHGWRVRLGVLQGEDPGNPAVPELLAASETAVLTAVQEGFGLPFLEAASAGKPLIARRLPNVFPDLDQFGFRFPQAYAEVLVDPGLFDWDAERRRQKERFGRWRDALPPACREWAGKPELVFGAGRPAPAAFSRLTLAAQLEVLARPPEESWRLCAPLNPFLEPWREAASRGLLKPAAWPEEAARWLGGEAYARRFAGIARSPGGAAVPQGGALAAQADFLRERLAAPNLFPLLWSVEP